MSNTVAKQWCDRCHRNHEVGTKTYNQCFSRPARSGVPGAGSTDLAEVPDISEDEEPYMDEPPTPDPADDPWGDITPQEQRANALKAEEELKNAPWRQRYYPRPTYRSPRYMSLDDAEDQGYDPEADAESREEEAYLAGMDRADRMF